VSQDPSFDVRQAHRYFSADCFNKAWELIEKPNRTPQEDEEMVRLNQTSIWHWTQRDDCKGRNLSIGYWQASRIHAILGRAEEAQRYGRLCLDHSRQEPPFFLAYAYEAMARAEKAAGNHDLVENYCKEAARLAESVADEQDRNALLNDLKTIS
jgi:hypothetical protein